MMKKPKILSALMVLGLSASLLGQVPVMAEEADQTQTTDAAGGIPDGLRPPIFPQRQL